MSFDGKLLEIFSWLPAKYLYKFSSVCKSSNELLFNDFFIRKQSKNMLLVGDTDFFLKPDCVSWYNNHKLEVHRLSPEENLTNTIPNQILDLVLRNCNIIASSNGVLCCKQTRHIKDSLFLFNPTTCSHLPIPHPDEGITHDEHINLVFDCHGENENMLMAIFAPPQWGGNLYTKIFSLEKMIWMDGCEIIQGERNILFEHSFVQNGVVYLISDHWGYLTKGNPFRWPYIVAYEINNSSSRTLNLPKGVRKGLEVSKLGIYKWGNNYVNTSLNSICLVKLCKDVFTVWVLKKSDGNSCYWRRILKMRVRAMGLAFLGDVKLVGFTIVNGTVLLFATEEKVYKYNLQDGINGVVKEVCRHHCDQDSVRFHSFSSTLRPCIN